MQPNHTPEAKRLKEKLAQIDAFWSPRIVAAVNDHELKLAKIEGAFDWHHHPDTDEVFFVIEGAMDLHFRDRVVHLEAGDLCVAPRGVEHKPVAAQPCSILLIEKTGTLNTGNVVTDRTREETPWI